MHRGSLVNQGNQSNHWRKLIDTSHVRDLASFPITFHLSRCCPKENMLHYLITNSKTPFCLGIPAHPRCGPWPFVLSTGWTRSFQSYSLEFPPVFAFTMSVSPVNLNLVYLCVSRLDGASRRKVAMSLGSDVFCRLLPLSLHL